MESHPLDEPQMLNFPIPFGPINEMAYSPSATYFSLWAPSAEAVRLNIYPTGEGGTVDVSYSMNKNIAGKWTCKVEGNLLGKFYTFQVKHKGQWLSETPGIFCKAVGINGLRAAIIDLSKTNPEGWEDDKRPELHDFSDIIIYELHLRDFSMDSRSGIKHKGKFLSLTESQTSVIKATASSLVSSNDVIDTSAISHSSSVATGISHLKELGITHVHLLPTFDFASIDEKHSLHSYNWGYDPLNYNVPEGSYSTDPYTPSTRIREFKQMILSLHQAGIRVILDMVFNHVYDVSSSPFERTVPGYFFRHKADGTLSNGSGCGNETASEMPMMRKFMVESVLYWLQEYHVDGFRFDLMGLHDIETMQAIREAVDSVDPSVFIYGEGWTAAPSVLQPYKQSVKNNISRLPRIAAFGDELRDSLRGPWTDDTKGAFILSKRGYDESLKFGIVAAIHHPQIDYSKVIQSNSPWAIEPTQMLSYVSCHDDLCLADRISLTLSSKPKGAASQMVSLEESIRLQKLALTAVLTSQGIPFLFNGDEILRSKQGVRNSYNSSDFINAIPWANKSKHQDLFRYILHLINIRKSHKVFRLGSAGLVRKHLHFLASSANVVAFLIDGTSVSDSWNTVVVILNGKATSTRVQVPHAFYKIICKDGEINTNGISQIKAKSVVVSPQSALIMCN